jgi:predicted flap endonuclease-1-like 5' DNA nuclease
MMADQAVWPKGVSKPAQRALASAGFTALAQLTQISEAELLKLHGMGPKAIRYLREALLEQGLTFAPAPTK